MDELFKFAIGIHERSKFYRNFYNIKHFEYFDELPFTKKQDLLNDQELNPPFGLNICVERSKLLRIHRTSGTSAVPLLLTLTKNDINVIHKVGAHAFRIAGVRKDDIVFNCMNYCMWMGGFTDHLSLEKSGGCIIPYGVGNTENLIALLLAIDQPSLHCTPSYLDIIKKVLKKKYSMKPSDLGLKKGFFGGEGGLQNQEFRDRIEDEWGLDAINANYGMSDVISILGAECSEKNGLHYVANDYTKVELIDADLNVLKMVDGAIGELVLTTLYKESQPLLRYRTNDVIEIISTEKCRCGEDSFRFKVVGRSDDMIQVKGINFYPGSLMSIISKYNSFSINYQIKISKKEPVDNFKLILEKNTENYMLDLEKLLCEIKEVFFVSPFVEIVDEIDMSGNKMVILSKVEEL